MPSESNGGIFADVMVILIDIFNLAEQLGIFFIAKQNDLDESQQQLFFFILFAVDGASVLKPLFLHPIPMVLFGIGIEVGEFVAYLMLLTRTTSLLVVAGLFFALEIIFYLISLCGLIGQQRTYRTELVKSLCTLPIRIVMYGLLFEYQILFLFLDPTSQFRSTFYEILILLVTFFGVSLVDSAAEKWCLISSDDSEFDENEIEVYTKWQSFLTLLNVIAGPIIMTTAVVYASEALKNKDLLKTYDFVIYIIVLVVYGSGLLGVAIALLCSLCCCAGALVRVICNCFHRSVD